MKSTVRAWYERELAAPADVVYAILVDYEEKHPSILPMPPFGDFEVLSGGQGAGTEITFTMTVMGKTDRTRGVVEEPEPGRLLVERYPEQGATTTFTVDPVGDERCRVRFETEWRAFFLRAWIERALVPPFLRKTYAEEMDNLERLAIELAGAASHG